MHASGSIPDAIVCVPAEMGQHWRAGTNALRQALCLPGHLSHCYLPQ